MPKGATPVVLCAALAAVASGLPEAGPGCDAAGAGVESCSAEPTRDHVLLQQPLLTSLPALRLRERLAADGDVVAKGAALAGVELQDAHHAILQRLRDAGPPGDSAKQQAAASQVRNDTAKIAEILANYLQFQSTVTSFYSRVGAAGADAVSKLEGGVSVDWKLMTETVLAGAATYVGAIYPLNPMVGVVATLAVTFLSGILGNVGDDKLKKLYSIIMKDVENMLNGALMDLLRVNLQSVQTEVMFLPAVMELTAQGAAQTFQKQLQLMWWLMMYNEVANLRLQFMGAQFCQPFETSPLSDKCDSWHRQCAVLQITDVILLHHTIIWNVGALEPGWAPALTARARAEVPGNINIVSNGMFACMRQEMGFDWAKFQRGKSVFVNTWQKLPFLFQMSADAGHKGYLKYMDTTDFFDTVGCLDKIGANCPIDSAGNGTLQGIYVTGDDMNTVEWLAGHRLKSLTSAPCSAVAPYQGLLSHITSAGGAYAYSNGCHRPSLSIPIPEQACLRIDVSKMRPWLACPAGYFFVGFGGVRSTTAQCCPFL